MTSLLDVPGRPRFARNDEGKAITSLTLLRCLYSGTRTLPIISACPRVALPITHRQTPLGPSAASLARLPDHKPSPQGAPKHPQQPAPWLRWERSCSTSSTGCRISFSILLEMIPLICLKLYARPARPVARAEYLASSFSGCCYISVTPHTNLL